jgi:hypothetical protein
MRSLTMTATWRFPVSLWPGAWRLWPILLAAMLLLAGCASAPVQQIKYFSQAFNTVNTLGQPLLDDLALAERTQGQQIAVSPMFKTLIEAPAARLTSAAASDPALAAVDIARIEAYRTTAANYVLLLDNMQTAWNLTVAAANSPAGASRLAALIQQTAELKGDAGMARKTFALLRSGGATGR